MRSSCMKLSFGERFFNLAANSLGGAAFPFEQPQPIPQPDDLLLFAIVHGVPSTMSDCERNKNTIQAAITVQPLEHPNGPFVEGS